jgi:hypothetical protein
MPQKETRRTIINDLRSLGVDVDALLMLKPTEKALKDLRDGLLRLSSMPELMVATRSMINSL